jgi:hypothetical protein
MRALLKVWTNGFIMRASAFFAEKEVILEVRENLIVL